MKSTLSLLRKNLPQLWKRTENACSAQYKGIFVAGAFHQDHSRQDKQGRTKISFVKFAALTAVAYGVVQKCKKKDDFLTDLYAAEGERKETFAGGSTRRNTYNFLADVVEMSSPAVVHIECVETGSSGGKNPASQGSGFIVESEGWIITNAHVVGKMSAVKVRLQDGTALEGRVIGVDDGTDLAVVEIIANDLPSLSLGCSNDIRPGEWVVAMGSPLNFKNTGTAGIISNIHRAGKELGLKNNDRSNMEYIQTDAMINEGNSGGPLINLDGEVIGVNSMMASAGIAFAIPIEYVKECLLKLKKELQRRRSSIGQTSALTGRRKYIGVTMLTLTQDIADQLRRQKNPDFPNVLGVYVHEVRSNSPAERAGILSGDVIIRIDGKEVRSTQDVHAASTNSSIRVTVKRGNKTLDLSVKPEKVE